MWWSWTVIIRVWPSVHKLKWQVLSISLISNNEHWQIWRRGPLYGKIFDSRFLCKAIAGANDSSLSELLHHFNHTANGIISRELHFFVSFPSRFVLYSFSASNSLQGGTHAPWSALSLLIHNRDNKPSLLSARGGTARFINTWSKAGYYDFPLRTRALSLKATF